MRGRGMSPFAAGLLAVALIAIGSYFGFTKSNPFSHQFRFSAVFEDAQGLKNGAAVRIAGINVGKVTKIESIEHGRPAARVEMEVTKRGLPIHRDARLQLRARIFLEGNLFVDLRPGSPVSPKIGEDDTLPASQTANSVKFSDVLAALQADTRHDLQSFLREYGSATDRGGAEGFNRSIKFWKPAYLYGSLANDASLGERPHDLSGVVRHQQRVFHALARNEFALGDLVVQLNRTAAAFARESGALEQTVPALDGVLRVGPSALRSLDSSLPAVRRFAVDALPGTRTSDEALAASTPFIEQARGLVSDAELKGLVADLRVAIPSLARLNTGTIPLLEQNRALSACQNKVLLPFSKEPIPDPDFPSASGQPWYKESPRSFVGLAGESRTHDANTPFFRVHGGGGPTTVALDGPNGTAFAPGLFPVLGSRPAKSARPPFRPGEPCELQQTPDLNAPAGPANETVHPASRSTPARRARQQRSARELARIKDHLRLMLKGIPSIDPLQFSRRGERIQAKRRGYVKNRKGVYVPRSARKR